MRLYNKTVRMLTALITVSVIFIFSSCNISLNAESVTLGTSVDFTGQNSGFRMIEKRAGTKVLSGENVELYLDEKSGAVSIYDRISQKIWNSLPDFENSYAADYILSIFDGEKICSLDTSTCLNSKDGFSYEIKDNCVYAVYKLSYESISVKFPVTYSLSGGRIKVFVKTEDITVSEGNTLISLTVLPYLGAVKYDINNSGIEVLADYFLVPDGVGAIMRTAVENDITEMTFSVYGKEYYKEYVNAPFGAYGIKNGENALSVTVTDGEENCFIKVLRSNADEHNINRIYPEFQITEISASEGKVNIAQDSFNGNISVVYETLNGENADYMGIANSVRQVLVGAGVLPEKTGESEYPLFVSVAGSTDGTKKTLTTSLQQTENLLSILKGKGVNEINIILEGFMKNGFDAKNGSVDISSAVGRNKDLDELSSYAARQQLKLFLGSAILTDSAGTAKAKNIFGENVSYSAENPLFPYIGTDEFLRKYMSASDISAAFSDILVFLDKENISGLCITDSDAKTVIADYSSKDSSLTYYNDVLKSNLSAAKVDNELMVSGFSLNTAEYADYIKDVFFETGYPEDSGYTAVPFIPAVIHSSCLYSGYAANTFAVPTLQLLKSIEYGAVPYYIWVFSSQSDKFYELTLGEAVDSYLDMKENLGDLASKRMTDHYETESGVFCTEYEGGTKVYVNYNNYSVLIGEVAVMPYDYLRIG